MSIFKGKICYWCGVKPSSWEHSPPKNLFVKKDNLIKVPSCKKHNEKMSQLDERMEQYIKMLCCENPKTQIDKTIKKCKDLNIRV